jgi:hypothetical protein
MASNRFRSFLLISISLAWLAPTLAIARPERIKPGMSYYSDDFVEEGRIRDLAEEKNYEEVYQFYTYYEALYDANARVVVFKEYRRGEVIRTERYRYDAKGELSERIVTPSES